MIDSIAPRTNSQVGSADRFGDKDVVTAKLSREIEKELTVLRSKNEQLIEKLKADKRELVEGIKFLPKSSARIHVSGQYVGIDDRYWYKIIKHRHLFRKPTYSIEPIYSTDIDNNSFQNFEQAVNFAKICVCDMHDLIKR
ncbi:MAG: hypothetical protein WC373_10865 [Smithella sp.]|jgi:hypothetical protein